MRRDPGGADPRLRRNKIHDGKQNGAFIQDSGLGTLEDNDITGNENAGVAIKTGNLTCPVIGSTAILTMRYGLVTGVGLWQRTMI